MSVGRAASSGVFVAGALAIEGIGWLTGYFPANSATTTVSQSSPAADTSPTAASG
jgi:hypothetical protein